MNAALDVDASVEVDIPPPAPLRRPRSPPRETAKYERDDSGSDKSKKFTSPGHHSVQKSGQAGPRKNFNNRQNDNQDDKPDRQFGKSDRQFDRPDRQFDKPDRQFDRSDRQFDRTDNQNRSNRQNDKSYRQGFDNGKNPPRRPQVANDGGNEGHRSGYQKQRYNTNQYKGQSQDEARAYFAEQNEEDWDDGIRDDEPPPQYRQYGVSSGLGFHEKNRLINARKVNQRSECWQNSQASKTKAAETPLAQAAKEATPESVKPESTPALVDRKPAPTNQRSSPAKQQAPPANQKVEQAPAANAKPPGSANDVTPTRRLVPKNCVIDLLSKDDLLLVSVENTEGECHSPGKGFVCSVLSDKYSAEYTALCEDYLVACEAESTPYTPSPGETFSVFNTRDSSWYRARCLSAAHCALLDSAKVLPLTNARSVRLPAAYESAPEFSAVLQADVKLGTTLKCVLKEKTANGWTVEVYPADGDQLLSRGEVSRWLPAVQYPPATAAIPEVPRPPVSNGSSVWIVHVTDRSNVYVRASAADSQRAFDAVLHDAALAGLNAKPLTTPPTMGSYVIGKYTDGMHYRALVKRTNVKQNKYLLEYVEYGNVHVNQLENLCECPANLQPSVAHPMTSRVALRGVTSQPLTPDAEKYLDTLKDNCVDLILTIPDASDTAQSGSEVILTVASNKENVNKKVEEMCTPEWLQIQKRGGDVLETETIMYNELQFLDLQLGAGKLIVVDFSALAGGTVSATRNDRPQLFAELDALTSRMAKYCESELGREPYLPKAEELCIAQMPPYPQWFRAVLAEQVSGPGGAEAEVCYIDYGNMERIPVSLLRKMLPEFARAMPAIANTVEIEDFPASPTADMLERALKYLGVDDEGRGTIFVDDCVKTGPGWYKVKSTQLIAAMLGK